MCCLDMSLLSGYAKLKSKICICQAEFGYRVRVSFICSWDRMTHTY